MGKERKLNQTVFEIFKTPKTDNLLMDALKVKSWRDLLAFAEDKEFWKSRVRTMSQQQVVHLQLGKHVVKAAGPRARS